MGNSINAFLSGFLGSIGDDMQQKREQEIISKAREISSDRQILMTIWSDPNATPGAKARVLQALGGLGQAEGKLGKKPKKGEQGLDLSSIMGPIINMPAENQMGPAVAPSGPEKQQVQPGGPGGVQAGPQNFMGVKPPVMKEGLFRSQQEISQEQQAAQEQEIQFGAQKISAEEQAKREERLRWGIGHNMTGEVLQKFSATGQIDKPSTSMKVITKGVDGSEIQDQAQDAFGKPIDPKQTYDRVQTADGLVYMPGMKPKQGSPSVMSMIVRANAGDPEALKALRVYQGMQIQLAGARGEGFGAGRAKYMINQYMDEETGEPVTMSNFDAIQQIRQGKHLMLSGRLPFATAVSVQQLMSEAEPALEGVRKSVGAFDNAKDRAVFARVLAGAGLPTYGAEASWMGNVLNQVIVSDLTPQGRQLVVGLRRLNETMGRLRSTIGLPATESAMALTLSMLPGPATPDSKFAGQQLDQLQQVVTQAVDIPAYGMGGIAGKGTKKQREQGATIPAGSHIYYDANGNEVAK